MTGVVRFREGGGEGGVLGHSLTNILARFEKDCLHTLWRLRKGAWKKKKEVKKRRK